METREERLKVAFLTAGGAGMYCGSCMRDNAAAAELIRQGHEVTLTPLYTPIRTDEASVSKSDVYFGGISAYLRMRWPWMGSLPRPLISWLDSPWLIQNLAGRSIKTSAKDLGELTLSMLRGAEGPHKREVDRLVGWLADDARPQLVDFSNLLISGCLPALKKKLPCPIAVTLQGDDLFIGDLVEPYQAQAIRELQRLAEYVDHFITFSHYYAGEMSQLLNIPLRKFAVVPLGIQLEGYPDPLARYQGLADQQAVDKREGANRPVKKIGFFARHCRAKGFHTFVDAFLILAKMPGMDHVRLHSAGWLGEGDRAFYDQQLSKLREAGLAHRYENAGVLDREEKIAFLSSLDLMSIPTEYREPKGLSVLEALAAGTPVVQPAHGAFPEMLESTQGGKLVPPNDPIALAEAWRELLQDDAKRKSLGLAGASSVRARHGLQSMANGVVSIYRSMLSPQWPPALVNEERALH